MAIEDAYMFPENVLYSFGKRWVEGSVKINPNGDVIILKELSNAVDHRKFNFQLIYTTKKFNILDGAEYTVVGSDAYFMAGCPVLRANTLHDVHNMIYIPNFEQPENSFWIHFVSKEQRDFWKKKIDAIILANKTPTLGQHYNNHYNQFNNYNAYYA